MSDTVQKLADTFTFRKQRDELGDAVNSATKAISDTAEKAKSFLKPKGPIATWTPSPVEKTPVSAPKVTPSVPKPMAPKVKGSFEKGGTVPETGIYKLHAKEEVLPKKEAEKHRAEKGKSMTKIKDAMNSTSESLGGKKEEKPKKELSHMVVKKAKSGGYIHQHHHTAPEHHPMEEHVTPDQDAMVQHMMQHMGEANPGEAEADAGQSGIPAGAQAAASSPAGAGPQSIPGAM